MIDIHTHIIPFVDDGSTSLEDSLVMIKDEVACGVDTIICTPHHIYKRYDKPVDEIIKNFELLNDAVKKENIPVTLKLGQEIYYSTRENIVDMLNKKQLLTLDSSKTILLEFSFTEQPEDIEDIIYNFGIKGYQVIIAHVERYAWMNEALLDALRYEGALVQVNANALTGDMGWKQKRFVKRLIKHNKVDIIASDVHSFRKNQMGKVSKKLHNREELFNIELR